MKPAARIVLLGLVVVLAGLVAQPQWPSSPGPGQLGGVVVARHLTKDRLCRSPFSCLAATA